MNRRSTRARALFPMALLGVALSLVASAAAADDAREAGKHFQRGVALYSEADYRAALVEFKRAYATLPNAAVLYNVGEAEYQLEDYAGALGTFERYLAETTASDPHHAEVEGDLDVLRARVGHLSVTTIPAGAEVAIDDQPAGRAPFDKALLVSVGRRKVVATMAGHAPVTRYIDVAADDDAQVTLSLLSTAPAPALASSAGTPEPSASHVGRTLRILGWTTTVLASAGGVTFGVLAMRESNQLEAARAAYPTPAATLSHDAGLTTTYAVLADSMAALAVVVGGITLYSTLSSSSSAPPKQGSLGGSRVSLGLGSARFEMTF